MPIGVKLYQSTKRFWTSFIGHTPETIVVCKLNPILYNYEAFRNVDLYNNFIKIHITQNQNTRRSNSKIKNNSMWSLLLWDNIYLNDEHGVPFSRNCLCSDVCQYSNDLPRPKTVPSFSNRINYSSANRNHPYSRTHMKYQSPNMLNKPSYYNAQGYYH